MPIRSGLSELLSNPLVQFTLAAKGAGMLAGAYNEAQNQPDQEAINAALASGQVQEQVPRSGLLSHFLGPRNVSPDTLNQEKIGLQQQQMGLHKQAIEDYNAFGPAALNNPAYKNLGLSSMMGPGGAPNAGMEAVAKQIGMDPAVLASLPPKQQEFILTQMRAEQAHKDTLGEQQSRDKATKEYRDESAKARLDQEKIANDFKQQMINAGQEAKKDREDLKNEKDTERKRARFDQQTRNLQSDRKATLDKLTSTTSPADPKTVQTLLDHLNARAKDLQRAADANDYNYDPDELAPMNLGKETTWWGGTKYTATSGTVPDSSETKSGAKAAPAATPTPKAPAGADRVIKDPKGRVVGHMKNGKPIWLPGMAPK